MTEQTSDHQDESRTEADDDVAASKSRLKHKLRYLLIGLLALILLPLLYAGYAYAASPQVVRDPKLEHYHFRMQVLVNGKAENFGTKGYQVGYSKDQCNANLPEQPIHFHDNKDQFTHIHWEGMTGGMVMKYYGWNFIGGLDNALGYKVKGKGGIQKVTTHGDYLPAIPEGTKFFVYTGDENGIKERNFDDWKGQDLEKFFGTTSNFPAHKINQGQTSFMDKVFPKAYAHDTGEHAVGHNTADQEELKRINNLIGNVIVFVQKDKPTDGQIKERFNKLEPLTDSTCGG